MSKSHVIESFIISPLPFFVDGDFVDFIVLYKKEKLFLTAVDLSD